MSCVYNNKENNITWNEQFDNFSYFVITKETVVGVYASNERSASGWIICAAPGFAVDMTVELDIAKIAEKADSQKISVEQTPIPEWWKPLTKDW